jgi:2-methylisocitrate lyase-like PEP mutase family enzyme
LRENGAKVERLKFTSDCHAMWLLRVVDVFNLRKNMTSFRDLHHGSDCLIIGNAWDAMSAVIMEQVGFRAIGTTSWGIANSFGYQDGEVISFEQLTRVVQSILDVVKIPVSVDMESGYANHTDGIVGNILTLAKMGCAGVNLEDSIPQKGLKEKEIYARTIAQTKQALLKEGFADFFINARIDTYLQLENPLEETIRRAKLYEQSGADGVFVPCMTHSSDIQQLLAETRIPLNLMSLPNLSDIAALAKMGVKRFSFGNAMSDAIVASIESLGAEILATQNSCGLYQHAPLKTTFVSAI